MEEVLVLQRPLLYFVIKYFKCLVYSEVTIKLPMIDSNDCLKQYEASSTDKISLKFTAVDLGTKV